MKKASQEWYDLVREIENLRQENVALKRRNEELEKNEAKRLENELHLREQVEMQQEMAAELELTQEELQIQNEELKQARHSLDHSHQNYVNLFEHSPIANITFDVKGKILDINFAAAKLLNGHKNKLVGKPFPIYIPNKHQSTFFQHRQKVMESRHALSCEMQIRTTTGEIREVQIISHVGTNIDGEVDRVRSALLDITERKQLEAQLAEYHNHLEAMINKRTAELIQANQKLQQEIKLQKKTAHELRQSQERFILLFNSLKDSVFVHKIIDGQLGNFIEVNDAACKRLGYSREELLQIRPDDIDFHKLEPGNIQQSLHDHGEATFEQIHVTRDGRHIPVEIHAHTFQIDGHKAVVSIARDISDRKEAEQKLRESEQRFRELANLLPQVIYETDEKLNLVFVNRASMDIFGYTKADLSAGMNIMNLVVEADRERVANDVKKRIAQQESTKLNEFTVQRKDGNTFPVLSAAQPIFKAGAFKGFRGILIDITQIKNAEAAIRRNEERQQALLDLHAMNSQNIDEVAHFALEQGIQLTRSQTGLLTFIDDGSTEENRPTTRKFAINYSTNGLIMSEFQDAINASELFTYLRTYDKPFIRNELEHNSEILGDAIANVDRLLAIPLKRGRQTVGAMIVVNKSHPYDYDDIRQLELLLQGMWDIIQSKRFEQALIRSKHFIETVTASSPNIIYIYDLRVQKFVYSNRDFKEFFMLRTPKTSTSETAMLMENIHPDDQAIIQQLLKRWQNTDDEAVLEAEFRVKDQNGQWRWYHSRDKVFERNADGDVTQIVGTAEDITARKEAEIKLQENLVRLEALNHTKNRFFSILGHDLRNPISYLMMKSEFMQTFDHMTMEDMQNFFHEFSQKVHFLNDLLENLLEWARMQTGRMQFNPEWFDFHPVVEEILDGFSMEGSQKHISLEADVPPSIQTFADHKMIQTIIRNLVSNSIKFTREKGRVIVKAYQDDSMFCFEVIDDGVGMTAEKIEDIFRIDVEHKSTPGTANEKGTGLGLILCKELVEAHQGRIHVESQPGKMTRFIIKLPQN